MKPHIEKSKFGSITVDGREFKHDIVIELDGRVRKRKKKLSKEIYGTSHTISLAEAEHTFEAGVEQLVIGTGMFNRVKLSDEATRFFQNRNVAVHLQATSKAVETWNQQQGKTIGLFHITC